MGYTTRDLHQDHVLHMKIEIPMYRKSNAEQPSQQSTAGFELVSETFMFQDPASAARPEILLQDFSSKVKLLLAVSIILPSFVDSSQISNTGKKRHDM